MLNEHHTLTHEKLQDTYLLIHNWPHIQAWRRVKKLEWVGQYFTRRSFRKKVLLGSGPKIWGGEAKYPPDILSSAGPDYMCLLNLNSAKCLVYLLPGEYLVMSPSRAIDYFFFKLKILILFHNTIQLKHLLCYIKSNIWSGNTDNCF